MKRSNIIGIIAAAVVIIVSVVLISWYLRKTTPMLIQGTVECTTYKASSKVPGRIDDMKVAQVTELKDKKQELSDIYNHYFEEGGEQHE